MNYVLANIIVLIFEILYYSMFMYYSKQEGKFWKYVILFTIISIIGGFIGTNYLMSFNFLIIMILLGERYCLKIKNSFYDIFRIIIMLLFKYIIELPIYLMFINFIDYYFLMILIGIIKILILSLFKNKIRKLYVLFTKSWNENCFYTRYICSCFLYIYVIVSTIHLIFFS